MRILCVKPSMTGQPAGDALEPLVFALLAGLTPPEHQCVLADERLGPLDTDASADLVAITATTFSARRAYQVADEYRARGIPVVLGGHHATLLPDEALEHVDAVVTGDAEGAWPQVLRDAAAGHLARRYDGGFAPLTDNRPDRRLFAGHAYPHLALVEHGRGCRFACDFCSVRAVYRAGFRARPLPAVVADTAAADGRLVFFTDDNLYADRDSALALCRALLPLHLRWACQTSLDVAADPEALDLLAAAGCRVVIVGFESLVRANLEQMGKPWNTRYGTYEELVGRFRDHGIMVYGTFVFGYDHDTADSIAAAVEFALRTKLFLANFNVLTPTPGTPLYDRLRAAGRLLHDRWWLAEAYRYGDCVFRPGSMPPDELAERCYQARCTFNSHANIWSRALDRRANLRDWRNLGLFAAANLVSRREIHRKQGQPLGTAAAPAAAGPMADSRAAARGPHA